MRRVAVKHGITKDELVRRVDDFLVPDIDELDVYKRLSRYDVGWTSMRSLEDFPDYARIASVFNRLCPAGRLPSYVCVYNGIVTSNSYNVYSSFMRLTGAGVLLLKDVYRPELPISRLNITYLPLVARYAMHVIGPALCSAGERRDIYPYRPDTCDFGTEDVFNAIEEERWITEG